MCCNLCVRSGCEMRAKIIFATLVGLLFCSLATLEIAELVRLADDTSNDFSVFDSQQAPAVVVGQNLELQRKTYRTAGERETSRVSGRFAGTPHRTRDVLHLLCIMRT